MFHGGGPWWGGVAYVYVCVCVNICVYIYMYIYMYIYIYPKQATKLIVLSDTGTVLREKVRLRWICKGSKHVLIFERWLKYNSLNQYSSNCTSANFQTTQSAASQHINESIHKAPLHAKL